VPERERFLLGDAPLMASDEAADAMSPRTPVMFTPEAASTAFACFFPPIIALLSCAAASGPLALVTPVAGEAMVVRW
jgi:hypothetical protein